MVLVAGAFAELRAAGPTIWKTPDPKKAPEVVVWFDAPLDKHVALVEQYAKEGYRTVSLGLYGDRATPSYAATMIKRPTLLATKQFDSMDRATWQKTFDDMSKQGWGPFIVTATGAEPNPLFAAVFREMKPTPKTRDGMSAAEFSAENQTQMAQGNILTSVDSYGTATDTRFIATWHPNVDNCAWNCDAVDVDGPTKAGYEIAFGSVRARPRLIAMTPTMNFVEMFDDTTIGHWELENGMTGDAFLQDINKAYARGVVPLRFAAKGTGAQVRFAALFTGRETPDPRVWKTTGSPGITEIDSAIQAIMKTNQVRGASLAVVQDTRLVYAKGYSWAENGYPAVLPTTHFRQASVSKVFTALAIYQLIHEKKLMLDTKIQSVLQLKTPTGGAPTDPRFSAVTVRHCLEHTCGLDVNLLWDDVPVSQAFPGTKLPVQTSQLASYLASLPLQYTPGDMAHQSYNNTGYFVLDQVVAKLRGKATFADALQDSMMKPLGIAGSTKQGPTTVREARTSIALQPADEARYHSRPLQAYPSVVLPKMPLAALGYGEPNYENIGGAGGLTASAVEVARTLAALSVQKNNPLFDEDTRLLLLKNAAATGGHGFDWVAVADAKQHLYYGVKGGYLPPTQNAIYFTTHGLTYVICWNGLTPGGEAWYPAFKSVLNAAQARNWGDADLFPQYGMPSFDKPAGVAVIQVPKDLHLLPAPGKISKVTAPVLQLSPKASLRLHVQQLYNELKNFSAGPVPPKPGDPNALNPQPEPPGKAGPGDPGPVIKKTRETLTGILADLERGGTAFDKQRVQACKTKLEAVEKALTDLAKARDAKAVHTAHEEVRTTIHALAGAVAPLLK
jgi:CubicO group peptidase (beta-lactamase class C family)